jgi:hypothetical protein
MYVCFHFRYGLERKEREGEREERERREREGDGDGERERVCASVGGWRNIPKRIRSNSQE